MVMNAGIVALKMATLIIFRVDKSKHFKCHLQTTISCTKKERTWINLCWRLKENLVKVIEIRKINGKQILYERVSRNGKLFGQDNEGKMKQNKFGLNK